MTWRRSQVSSPSQASSARRSATCMRSSLTPRVPLARVLRLCAGVAHYTSPESGARTLIRTLVQNDVTVCFTNPGTSEMVRDPRVLCPRCAAPQLFLMSRAALRRGP
jgi:hypothetical protein